MNKEESKSISNEITGNDVMQIVDSFEYIKELSANALERVKEIFDEYNADPKLIFDVSEVLGMMSAYIDVECRDIDCEIAKIMKAVNR